MKITMIGTGYVGLVTGACFAEVGNDVLCLDVDQRKIDILNAGGVPIHEPGLDTVIARNVAAGRLRFTTDVDAAVANGADYLVIGRPITQAPDPLAALHAINASLSHLPGATA